MALIEREPLTPAQVRGFWAAWAGWTLDGMDSFIFALVLAAALGELLPRSGLDGSPSSVVFAGSVLFAVFLAGWGTSLVWGPIADRLFFLGLFGGNFAMYNLWLPEQYPTAIRATAFAFVPSVGRFIGAGVNFLIAAGVHRYGSVGVPVAATAVVFLAGIIALPYCLETRGKALPL